MLSSITPFPTETDRTRPWLLGKNRYTKIHYEFLLVNLDEILTAFCWYRNPMCSVFPTVTSCDIPNIGAAGGGQVGLKVLRSWRSWSFSFQDTQRAVRAHSEHHQREDLFGSLVLVRRSFSSFYILYILPSKVRFPCSGFSSFHRLQNHHPVLHRREVQPSLQDGRRHSMTGG